MDQKTKSRLQQSAEEDPLDYNWERLRLERHSREIEKLANDLGIDLNEPEPVPAPPPEKEGPGFWKRAAEFGANLGRGFAELGEGAVKLLTESPLSVPLTPEAKAHQEQVVQESAPQRQQIQDWAHVPIELADEAVDYWSEGDPSWWSQLAGEIGSEAAFPAATLKKVAGVGPLLKEGAKLIPWNVGLQGAREYNRLPQDPSQDDYMTMAKRLGLTAAISPLIGAPMAKYLGRSADDVAKAAGKAFPVEEGVVQMQAVRGPSATTEEILSHPPTIKTPQAPNIQKGNLQLPKEELLLPRGDVSLPKGNINKVAEPPMDPTMVPRHFLPEEADTEIALRAIKGKEDIDLYGAMEKQESITDFIRQKGGLKDQGGELSHMHVDAERKPFQKSIIKKEGMTLDEAAEAAYESGLIPERNINVLLDAIDKESRGIVGSDPAWIQDVTKGKGALSRERVEIALEKIQRDKGADVGKDVQRVKEALLNDPEFADSPFIPRTDDEWAESIQALSRGGREAPVPEEAMDDLVPDELLDDLLPGQSMDDTISLSDDAFENLEETKNLVAGHSSANMGPEDALKFALKKYREGSIQSPEEAMTKAITPAESASKGRVSEILDPVPEMIDDLPDDITTLDLPPNILSRKEINPPSTDDSVVTAYEKWFGKMAKRHAMEEAGQEILDDLDEIGRTPVEVAQDFWTNTYQHLPANVQKKFKAMYRNHTGMEVADAKSQDELIHMLDMPNEVEYLEGTQRGLVSLMEEANRRFKGGIPDAEEVVTKALPQPSAAEQAMQRTTPDTLGEGGAIVLGHAGPQPPSPLAFRTPGMEATFQKGREAMDTPSFFDKMREGFADFVHGWTRTFRALPNNTRFARANEYLSQLKHAGRAATERAARVMKGVTQDLTPDEFDLFERLIIMRDAQFDALAGKTLPDGWTPQGVADELMRLENLLSSSPNVQRAVQLRMQMINELREELTNAKILNIDPANVNENYFPHIVRDYAEEAIKQAESGTGMSIKKKTPWYAKSRKGTNKLYNFNYLEAESAYLQKAFTDLETAKVIRALKDEYDILPKLQKAARDWNKAHPNDPPRTWEDMGVPDGYSLYRVDPSATFYSAFSTGEHAIDEQIAGLADALAKDENLALSLLQGADKYDMLEILATLKPTKVLGRPKAPMVIPDELEKTLVNLGRGHEQNAWRKLNGAIKEWLLIAPHKVLRYNINNLVGDMEAVWVGNSKILTDGKLTKSIHELWNIFRGHTGPTADYLDALRLGVIDTGQITTELSDPNAFASLMRIDPRSNASWGKMAEDLIKRGWGSIRKWNQFRENMLRYGAYKHYKEALDAGQSISYGASKKDVVDALATNEEKAAKLARELLGDYAAVSESGQKFSRDIMMFYRWVEVNATRYNQILQNTQQEAGAAAIGGKAAALVAVRAAKLMTWMTLVSMWNKYIIGEDWEKLPKHARSMPNVVMPMYRDENDSPRYIRTEGSFADLMKTAGFDDIYEGVDRVTHGEITWGEFMQEAALAPPKALAERAFTGMYPHMIGGVEFATGHKYWPDAENPREIHDMGRHLSEKFGLKHGYDLLAGNREFQGEDAILDTFSYKPDILTDSYETKSKVRSDLERYRSKDETKDVLHEWVQALQRGNQSEIDRLKPQVEGIVKQDPGTYKRTMDGIDPTQGLGKTDRAKHTREDWLKTLGPEERRRVERAMEKAKAVRKADPFKHYTVPKRGKDASRYRKYWGF